MIKAERNSLHNNSLEATWDAPLFAIDTAVLLSWKAGVGEFPGASARGRYAAYKQMKCKNHGGIS
jgi:hypothetical protein